MRLKNDDLFPANSIDGPEPEVIFGTDAVDGTLAPWYGAPLGTLYIRTTSGYVNVWQKFADSGLTTDWRNTMGGVAQTYELTLQSAATSTGNGTVAADVGGYGTLLVELSGTFSATVTFEGSRDGSDYYALLASNLTTGAKATTATAAGVYQINFAGLSSFRARISSYSSGSVTAEATFVASDAGSIITSAASVTVSSSDAGTSIGTTSDSAVTTDTTGTVIGFLRGIVAWFARLGSLDGAAFTAGSSYVWPGLAGSYQSTVSVLTAGQRGLARLTARRAVVTAGDRFALSLTSGTPIPAGSDITDVGTLDIVSGDLDIRDTSAHYFVVPMDGWNKCLLGIIATTGFDQIVQVWIYGHPAAVDVPQVQIAQFAFPASAIGIAIGGSTTGQGGEVGGATAGAADYYAVPAINDGFAFVSIALQASVSPSVGSFKIDIVRSA